jgi:hypothetical protein
LLEVDANGRVEQLVLPLHDPVLGRLGESMQTIGNENRQLTRYVARAAKAGAAT